LLRKIALRMRGEQREGDGDSRQTMPRGSLVVVLSGLSREALLVVLPQVAKAWHQANLVVSGQRNELGSPLGPEKRRESESAAGEGRSGRALTLSEGRALRPR
jgi:hypothetical protein